MGTPSVNGSHPRTGMIASRRPRSRQGSPKMNSISSNVAFGRGTPPPRCRSRLGAGTRPIMPELHRLWLSGLSRDLSDPLDRKGWSHQEAPSAHRPRNFSKLAPLEPKDEPVVEPVVEPQTSWIQCTNENCFKWRRIPADDPKVFKKKWTCYHNPDASRSRCDAPEEHPIEELIVYLEVHKVRFTELFNLLDRDHGSTVDLEEFKGGIERLGVNCQRVEELFAEIDTDHSGEIDFKELRRMMEKIKKQMLPSSLDA